MIRIVLSTNGGFPGAAVLDHLHASPGIQLAGIVLSTRILSARYGFLRGAWEQYRRSGLRYTLYLGWATAPRLRATSIPLVRTKDINRNREFIKQLSPDLLVSAFFNQKIGESIVAIPRCGAVNIHPSLLPAFRGVDPVFYAKLSSSPALGVSVHRISPELDCGNILAQEEFPAAPHESVLAATTRLYRAGAELLIASLDDIVAGARGTPQAGEGNYDSWPSCDQVAALRRKGMRLV
ncbi:MAG: formyltransferase family protein [Burkholderiales bacterium]